MMSDVLVVCGLHLHVVMEVIVIGLFDHVDDSGSRSWRVRRRLVVDTHQTTFTVLGIVLWSAEPLGIVESDIFKVEKDGHGGGGGRKDHRPTPT